MITLHHLEYSQSFRILWLLEELGADYELKIYERDPKTRLAPKAYKNISPLGTSPVITDGRLSLAETNAITDYILDKFDGSPLRPAPGDPARVKYLFWLHTAQGSMMPLLLFKTVFGIMRARSPGLIRPLISVVLRKTEESFVEPRMKALLDLAEADLSVSKWLAGDNLTAADIVMSYGMEAASIAGMIDTRPNCQRWVKQMHDSPSFAAAREKDGRDDIAFRS